MSDGHLPSLLRSAGWLTLFLEVLRAACAAFGALLAAGLAALAIDALLGLYPWGLLTVDVLLVALLACAALYVGRQAWRNLFNSRRMARQIELRLGIEDSQLINSVDFLESQTASASPQLVQQSVRRGEEVAAQFTPLEAVDLRRPLRASAVAVGALVFVAVAYLAAPRVFAMVLPRYLDPTGDHPPFTLMNFEITVAPDLVYQGKPATVSARLSGLDQPDQANVVFLDGQERQRLPMFRNTDGVFVLAIERAERSREFYIETPKGRSRRQMMTVLAVPCFESASVAYRFPEYTGWPSTGHALDSRGIRALEKTKVIVSATANLPLRGAKLELFAPEENPADKTASPASPEVASAGATNAGAPGAGEWIPAAMRTVLLEPDEKQINAVKGSFTLESNGRYRLTLVGVDGIQSHEQREGAIVSVPDQPPQVAILDPEPLVAAVEGWKVPVTVQAIDDVGIDRITLFAGVNGWGPDPTRLSLEAAQPTVVRGRYEFDLGRLGARAGDIITYYASAYDNHPSGTHFSDTPTYVIHVISQAEFAEFARQKYRMEQIESEFEALQKRLDGLKNQREKLLEQAEQLRKKLESGQKLTDAELKKLADLEAALKQFADQAQTLAKDLAERAKQAPIYEMEKSYRESLERLGKQLANQAANAEQLRRQAAAAKKQPASGQARKGFAAAASKLAKDQQPFDQASQQQMAQTQQDMEKMRLADQMVSHGEHLRAAILEQRELADRLAQYRAREKLTGEDLSRIERMAKEQELLREEVAEAKADLAKSAQEARSKLPNMSAGALKLCEAIDSLHIGDDQSQAARSARAGQGNSAFQSAESAAKKLESLLSSCCTPKNAVAHNDLDGCFKLPKPGLEQMLQQLSQGRGIPNRGGQGQNGSGFAGSQSRMAVFGPHQFSRGESDSSRSSGKAAHGRGQSIAGSQRDNSPAAESLDAGARQAARSAAGNLHGVPVGYRDQAEAYFKRIAKEE